MSFGYGIGDVVVVGKLAWTVYKSCKDAPASFGNISQEVIALEAVIRQFEEAFEGQVLSVIEQERLRSVGQGCKDVLQELQELVQKYEGLGSNAKLSFDRLKWGAAPVDDLRTRLMSNTLLLSAFLQTSPVVIKKHIRKILQEYREGKREGSIFSSVSADSLTADERIQWRAIRKELENSGLTLAVLDSNRDLIIECLTNALNSESIQNHAAVSTHEKKGNGRVLRSAVSNSEGFTADSIAESIFKASAEKEQKNLTRPTGVPLNILEGEMADLKPSSSSIQAQTKGNAVGKPLMAISTSGKVDKDTEFLEPPSRISFFRALRKLRPQPTAEVQKAVQISAMIDKRIMADQAARSRDVKILLLGQFEDNLSAGESGKTTLLRQMRLLHTGNYSYDEREEFRQDIFSNLIIACKTIIDEMRDQEISLSNVESEKAAQIIEEAQHIDPDDAFSPECYAAIKTLKRDGGFQSMLERGHEFALYDNTT
ncbi:hypothetical protein MMC18_003657 [Xylographa bjoerkii]|nr:hypothetical protein [Xylographa bjoerkii]